MHKKILLAFAIIMLVSGAAHAFQLSVQDTTISVPTIGTREIAVKLTSTTAESIAFSLVDSKPWISLDKNFIKLEPFIPSTVKISASPYMSTPLGLYRLQLTAESLETGENKTINLFLSVIKGEVVDLEKITVSGSLQPTGEVVVSYTVKNFRTSTANDITIKSIITTPEGKTITLQELIPQLNPDEEKTIEKTFILDEGAEAGDYSLTTSLVYVADVQEVRQSFYVAKRPVIVQEKTKSSLLFGYKTNIVVKNVGNAPATGVEVKDQLSSFEAMFFSAAQKPAIDGTNYKWSVPLILAGGQSSISYTVDYTSLYLFILAVIVLAYVYFFKLRTVRVKKYVLQKKELEEGEEFTIGVEVKNFSGKRIEEIIVEDFVPAMFTTKEGTAPHPSKKKSSVGTELTWSLSGLYHGEERLLSYKITPVFGVHGKIRLPRASVKFKLRNKIINHLSGMAHIGLEVEQHPISKLISQSPIKRKKNAGKQ